MCTSFPHNVLNFMGKKKPENILTDVYNKTYRFITDSGSLFVYSDSFRYFYGYLSNIYSISHI